MPDFPERHRVEAEEEKPPVMKTWGGLYTFVLAYLFVLILIFWTFTQHYKP